MHFTYCFDGVLVELDLDVEVFEVVGGLLLLLLAALLLVDALPPRAVHLLVLLHACWLVLILHLHLHHLLLESDLLLLSCKLVLRDGLLLRLVLRLLLLLALLGAHLLLHLLAGARILILVGLLAGVRIASASAIFVTH